MSTNVNFKSKATASATGHLPSSPHAAAIPATLAAHKQTPTHLPGACSRKMWMVPWSDAAASRRGASAGGEKARQVTVAGVVPRRNSSGLPSWRTWPGRELRAKLSWWGGNH